MLNPNDNRHRSSGPRSRLVETVLRIAAAGLLLSPVAFTATGGQSSRTSGGDGFIARLTMDLVFLAPLSLAADSASAGSDGNGVLEPGETVVVSPSWRNPGSSAVSTFGTASALAGPNAAFCSIEDGSANYGSVGPGETKAPATGDSYQVSVSLSAQRATHSDAHFTETLSTTETNVWTLHVGDSFSGRSEKPPLLPQGRDAAAQRRHGGVLSGNAVLPGRSGHALPDGPLHRPSDVRRRIRDPFLRNRRSLSVQLRLPAASRSLPTWRRRTSSASTSTTWPRGTSTSRARRPSSALAAVRRGAVAGFIAQALVAPAGDGAVPLAYGPDGATGRSYSCDAGAPNLHFDDVAASDPQCRHVHYLWARGFIAGCSDNEYCPESDVTRGQMAKFLVNGFQMNLSSPTTPAPSPTHTATHTLTPTRTPTPTSTPTPTTPLRNTVQLKTQNCLNPTIVPDHILIWSGETVRWTAGDCAHQLRSSGDAMNGGDPWDSGTIQPGASYERTFTRRQSSSYRYSCILHGESGSISLRGSTPP